MQILAGKFKGAQIQTRANLKYRPTQSKIRKSLFDMLGDLSGKMVLDLFAGSGILGFEALSRNARFVTFIEKNVSQVQLLKNNFKKNNFNNCEIRKMDALKYLKEGAKTDLILADPPYGYTELNLIIYLALKNLKTGGEFVLETSKKDGFLNSDREKIYGNTRLSFWKKQ